MSVEQALSSGELPPGAAVAPQPIGTRAAHALDTRVLVVASGEAAATAPHVDLTVSGLVVAGSAAGATVKALRRQHPDLVLAIEPPSTTVWASEEAPFVLDQDGLIPLELDQVLDGQLQAGASIAVTPTAVVPAGDGAALKATLTRVNRLDRDDTLFLLPVHHRWLDPDPVKQLIAVITRSRHPVAVALADSDGNPLRHKGAIPGFRRLFSAAPWAMPWRTDLAGFDALAHGARAAAIGQLPSLRRLAFPDRKGFSSDKTDLSPHVLLPHLLRYARSSRMQRDWFASARPDTCPCPHCDGRGIDRFTGSDEQRLEAHLHNLHHTTALRQEIDALTTGQIAAWWRQRLRDAEYEHQALTGRTGVEVKPTPDVAEWANTT